MSRSYAKISLCFSCAHSLLLHASFLALMWSQFYLSWYMNVIIIYLHKRSSAWSVYEHLIWKVLHVDCITNPGITLTFLVESALVLSQKYSRWDESRKHERDNFPWLEGASRLPICISSPRKLWTHSHLHRCQVGFFLALQLP